VEWLKVSSNPSTEKKNRMRHFGVLREIVFLHITQITVPAQKEDCERLRLADSLILLLRNVTYFFSS
jgi:hypothetical protein